MASNTVAASRQLSAGRFGKPPIDGSESGRSRWRATSTSYRNGQVVRLLQPATIDRQPVARGGYLDVEDVAGNVVKLRGDDNRVLHWEPRANSLHVQVFDPKEKELQVGDRIRWSANNDAINAVGGRLATLVAVDPDKQRIDIEHKDGGRHQLDLKQREHQHFSHGYAVTAQRAQGADAFPIINAPSWRVAEVNVAELLRPGHWCQIGIANRSTDRLIGDVGICVAAHQGEAEIGFSMARHAQRKGLASEAVREAIRLVFEHSDVGRVIGITDARNLPSIRLLERVGLRKFNEQEAVFRDEPCTEYFFAVSRNEMIKLGQHGASSELR